MKNLNKLISQLRDWLSGNEAMLENLQTTLYDHLSLFTANLNSSQVQSRDIPVTVKMRQSLELDDTDLSCHERAHLLSIASAQIRRVLAEIEPGHDDADAPIGGLGRDRDMWRNKQFAVDFLTFDSYLKKLSHLDQRKASLFEWSYFGGLNYEEIAQILSLPIATIGRELRYARAWLCQEIAD